ncbi:hypothetical protein BDW74DRAFT_151747 [Aspergillus multicolor]|uniref:uncharacterized protein n=1 Tax=Aspergillus multicolor TaxID=41759 RepID=UPI003CCCBB62
MAREKTSRYEPALTNRTTTPLRPSSSLSLSGSLSTTSTYLTLNPPAHSSNSSCFKLATTPISPASSCNPTTPSTTSLNALTSRALRTSESRVYTSIPPVRPAAASAQTSPRIRRSGIYVMRYFWPVVVASTVYQ